MIFSVGHSTHSEQEFHDLVQGIDVIVDVRSHPTSKWEQWRLEHMREWLPATGIDVVWMPELGGWTKRHLERYGEEMAGNGVDISSYSKGAFPKQRIGAQRSKAEISGTTGPVWTNQGLYDFAWYTSIPEFREGLTKLVDLYEGNDKPKAAIMCCEACWWKCHRSMVADALWMIHSVDTLHIKPRKPKRSETMRWVYHSHLLGNRIHRYPAPVLDSWLA